MLLGALAGEPVSVQTSCAANSESCLVVALATLPTRFTTTVEPSMVTCCTLAPDGSSVSVAPDSQGVLGSCVSALTRLVSSCASVVPSGTNTESGTSTVSSGSAKKYRSCAL